VTGARKKRRPVRLPRAEWLGAVTGVLALMLLAALAVLVVDLSHDLRREQARSDALVQQVEGLGATPVAGPSGSRGEPGVSVTGPPGASGPQGEPGPSGSPGNAGEDGASGRPGASGAPGVPGSVGPTGPAGPAGPQGVQGEPGVQGPQGERGEKGDSGEQGPAGQSCPEGFNWQTPSYDPDARVCRRDGAPDPSESPRPSSPLVAGLDPRRLTYA
jgi:hypothetical protein